MKRPKALERLRARLLRRRMPRVQMAVIVAVTGLAAFLFSFLLLRAGLSSMALRYPLAATLAYLVFLRLLRLWLWAVRRRAEPDVDVNPLDLVDAVDLSTPRHRTRAPAPAEESSGNDVPDVPEAPSAPDGPGIDLPGFDLDDAAVFLIPIGLVLGGLFVAFYVVYFAPVLFAELILDGIIVTSLYRRFRHLTPEGWLPVAFRRTRMPFFALVIALFVIGLAAGYLVPGADSIGDVFRGGPDAR